MAKHNRSTKLVVETLTADNMVEFDELPNSWQEDLQTVSGSLVSDSYAKWVICDESLSGRTYFLQALINEVQNNTKNINLDLKFVRLLPNVVSYMLDDYTYLSALAQNLNTHENALVLVVDALDIGMALGRIYPNVRIVVVSNKPTNDTICQEHADLLYSWNFLSTTNLPSAVCEYSLFVSSLLEVETSIVYGVEYLPFDVSKALSCHILNNYPNLVLCKKRSENSSLLSVPLGIYTDLVRFVCSKVATTDKRARAKKIQQVLNSSYVVSILDGLNQCDESSREFNEYFTPKEQATIKLRSAQDVATSLKKSVFGQDEAIKKVIDGITVPTLGINDDNKPLRSMLFLGKTGTGKTETAVQLAKHLGTKEFNLVRIDMSEFGDSHESAKLIGSPPGYVGHETGGMLTNAVKTHPYSVVLLDEVEKAHPRVWDSFLQVLDAGRLTDGQGQTVDFSKCVIIMTSNIGAKETSKEKVGFTDSDFSSYKTRQIDNERIINKALSEVFRPELINRVDDIVIFNEINEETARQVINKRLKELNTKLQANYNVRIRLDKQLVQRILQQSNYIKYGARDINKVTTKLVTKALVTVPDLQKKRKTVRVLRISENSNGDIGKTLL